MANTGLPLVVSMLSILNEPLSQTYRESSVANNTKINCFIVSTLHEKFG
jgi:hypothetical protein